MAHLWPGGMPAAFHHLCSPRAHAALSLFAMLGADGGVVACACRHCAGPLSRDLSQRHIPSLPSSSGGDPSRHPQVCAVRCTGTIGANRVIVVVTAIIQLFISASLRAPLVWRWSSTAE